MHTTTPAHVVIVGAGPGGLAAALALAGRGYRVTIVEKCPFVGGRNSDFVLDGFRFDLGPTFLMMRHVLDQVFASINKKTEDYLSLQRLDPLYALNFSHGTLAVSDNHERTVAAVERLFPGEGDGVAAFLTREKEKYARMYPCLTADYSTLSAMWGKNIRHALPYLDLGRSVYDVVGRYFHDERLRLAFTFQSKYLGMAPWECPGAFTIIPYIEHTQGIWHVMGGLAEISRAMARAAREIGVTILSETPIREVIVRHGDAMGVACADGRTIDADAVFINADFGHAATHLFAPGVLRQYTESAVNHLRYSCSTFMIYLGLDRLYPQEAFHQIVFADDYRGNLMAVARDGTIPQEPSFYIRNASVVDASLAPAGQSALYILVPMPNTQIGGAITWKDHVQAVRTRVLDQIARRTGFGDLRPHIVTERIITPDDWEAAGVHFGATFNLAHTLGQMLYFRPHNRFRDVGRCYLVGGGTHPGSGLPTIYQSALISARLFDEDYRAEHSHVVGM